MSDDKKRFANQLARLLLDDRGFETFRLLQATQLLTSTTAPVDAPRTHAKVPTRIGPFELRADADTLVRVDDAHINHRWTSHEPMLSLRKASGVARVCLIGESAAAAMFYSPAVSNAKLLANALREAPFEVIDLTQIGMTPATLIATAATARQHLDPDVLVVFAGNNWTLLNKAATESAPLAEAQRYASLLREDGVHALMRSTRAAHTALTQRLLAKLAEGTGTTKMVLVVPPVNHADWQRTQPVAWLGSGKTTRWHDAYEAARGAIDAGDHAHALTLADEMLALDRGTTPTSHRLRALALQGQGRLEEARDAAADEHEASTWNGRCWNDAGTTRDVADAMRAAVTRHGFSLVDLPAIFAAAEPFPGRALFVDYCHLSFDGMKLAMNAVAAHVLRVTGSTKAPAPLGDRVAPAIDALAKLQVLFINRLQEPMDDRRMVLEHWCRETFDASPEGREALRSHALAVGAACPELFSAWYQKLFETSDPLQFFHAPGLWPFLDVDCLEVICALFEERGESITELVNEALCVSLAVEDRADGIDISHFSFAARRTETLLPLLARTTQTSRGWPVFFTQRAFWRSSTHYLVSRGAHDVSLSITARVPHGATGTTQVSVNGQRVGEIVAGATWSKHVVDVGHAHLKAGINRVTLRWPALPDDDDAPLEDAIRRLERGVPTSLLPVFGEVYAMVAKRQ